MSLIFPNGSLCNLRAMVGSHFLQTPVWQSDQTQKR